MNKIYEKIMPNFLIVLGVLAAISVMLILKINPETLFVVDTEKGRVGVDAYVAAVFALLTVIVGGLIACLKDLLAPGPGKPEMTEESALKFAGKYSDDE